jgi:uncharacterized protein with HEPN domain
MKAEERDSVDFLMDILDSIENIEDFVKGFDFEKFSSDTKQYMQ